MTQKYHGTDIDLEDDFNTSTLRDALSDIFRIPKKSVYVFDFSEGWPDHDPEERLVGCEVVERNQNGFILHLSLTYPAGPTPIDIGKLLSSKLNTRCLIPGTSLHAYEFNLVNPDGSVKNVDVDVEVADEHGWLIINEDDKPS